MTAGDGKPAGGRRDTAGVIAPPPLIALGVVASGLLLDWLLPAYVLWLLLSAGVRIAFGLAFIICGMLLGVAAIMEFRAHNTHIEPWKPSSAIVTTGVYAWLRNPMYVGMASGLAGLSILLASDWMLVIRFENVKSPMLAASADRPIIWMLVRPVSNAKFSITEVVTASRVIITSSSAWRPAIAAQFLLW